MHCFQPIPAELFELNPFEKIGTDWMLITAEKKGKPNTMTASWGGFGVLWGKNVAYIVIFTELLRCGSANFVRRIHFAYPTRRSTSSLVRRRVWVFSPRAR